MALIPAVADIRADRNYLYLTGESKSLHPVHNWAAYLMKVNIDSINTSIYYEHYERLISDFHLEQNYPNPFNSETMINYQLPHASEMEISIFNLLGQKVTTLVNATQTAGFHKLVWNGKDMLGQPVSSGAYFYQLKIGKFMLVKKMMLLR